MSKSTLTFHPEIFQILGEKLVSDPVIALAELVKNAYDADAEKVIIRIDTKKSKSITIEDDGHGMSIEDIENGWLIIGTPNKRKNNKSKFKERIFTGSMGIGRLASFSLANKLSIDTSTSLEDGTYSKTSLSIDLKKLLKLDNLNNFTIDIKYKVLKKPIPIRTIITLSNLKWIPNNRDIGRIVTRLSILCSPTTISDFKIEVIANNKKYELDPEHDFPASPITVCGKIDEKGIATYNVEGNHDLYLFDLKRESFGRKSLQVFDQLKNVNFLAYWYPLGRRPKIQYWNVASRDFAKDMRDELAGVRVYRDGIRVLPYGEPGNDWLEIEKTYLDEGSRKRYPRSGQIVAWINTSREDNENLLDTANREGLIENVAFIQLKKFGQEAFSVLAEYRRFVEPVVRKEHVIDLDDTTKVEDAIIRVKNKFQTFKELQNQLVNVFKEEDVFIESMNALKEEIKNYIPTEDLENIEKGLNLNIQLVEDIQHKIGYLDTVLADVNNIEEYFLSFSEQMDKVSIYRDKLTAGNLVNLIVHDVGSAVKRATNRIQRTAEIECEVEIHNEMLPIIASLLPRISSAYDLLRGGSKVGVGKSQRLNVTEITNTVVNQLSKISWLDDDAIKTSDTTIYARMREADLWAVLTNLLINAITCSEYEHNKGRRFSTERKINLELQRQGRDLIIICEDNGPGLPDFPPEWIWEAFNSTRKGGGSGLGLFIISDIISWYGGTKYAGESINFKTGARFVIKLRDVIIGA